MAGDVDTTASLSFEDSFSPTTSDAQSSRNDSYVPLEDSRQYLAGLEGKLARIRGQTESSRKKESRRLLDALADSRSCHTTQLMQGTDTHTVPSADPLNLDTTPSSLASTIDPQGALGAMLRRVAPDRVALTSEELCHLLQADLLAQIHEAQLGGEAPYEDISNTGSNSTTTKDQEEAPAPPSGTLEHSSDEGEK